MKTLICTFALVFLVGACGGHPNVHQHMPKVPTKPVAVGAAAAAAAITLANPDASGKPPEDPTAPRNMQVNKSGEQVPMAALDRADEADGETEASDECQETAPAASEDGKGKDAKGEHGEAAPRLELLPTVVDGKAGSDGPAVRKKCVKPDVKPEAKPGDEPEAKPGDEIAPKPARNE